VDTQVQKEFENAVRQRVKEEISLKKQSTRFQKVQKTSKKQVNRSSSATVILLAARVVTATSRGRTVAQSHRFDT
jgi:hypothetical protein